MSQRRVRYEWVPDTKFESSGDHHAFSRTRRFPGSFRMAPNWRALPRAVRSLLETNSVHEGISGESSLALGIPFPGNGDRRQKRRGSNVSTV
jgi:hypothetical protein